jgi:hypothetical protein
MKKIKIKITSCFGGDPHTDIDKLEIICGNGRGIE